MDQSWLEVPNVARELGVSPRRVRDLLESGALRGRKVGRSWLIDPQDVQRRAAHDKHPGRALSPQNAWRLLILIDECAQATRPSPPGRPLEIEIRFDVSAVDRSRLRVLLYDIPGPTGLARLVSSRADIRRVRAHPGLIERAANDSVVSVGGARAVAKRGGGLAAGGRHRLYIHEQHFQAFVRRYKLVDDIEGNIDLAVIPHAVDPLVPEQGHMVPIAVGWAGLLDDPDSRARHAAHEWVMAPPRPVVIPDGRRR